MTSRVSFFDGAIFKRSLRKTMPLWSCYFFCWLFLLPGGLLSFDYRQTAYQTVSGPLCEWILNFCSGGIGISALIGLLAAWILFSWLFHTNSAYFYASLPVRRETLFLTHFSVGLLMVTAVNLLISLIAYLITLLHGYAQFAACASVFGTATLSFLGFYGFAVLLSVIIGQSAAMPAVYVILNFASAVIYYAVQYLSVDFVYGMNIWWRQDLSGSIFHKLSPLYYLLLHGFSVEPCRLSDGTLDSSRYCFASDGWRYVAVLAGVGILLTILALLLFRRREMERSGDVIAVKPLRPVFLYCFSFGCAIVIAYILSSLQSNVLYGAAAFRKALLLLLLGAFFGYFAAQMMLRKSVSVFRGKKIWAGFCAVCLVLLLGCTALRYDIFGVYSRVPDKDAVTSVYINGTTSYAPSDIEAAVQFQQLAIERRTENDAASGSDWASATITYTLTDGSDRSFRYRLAAGTEQLQNPDSLICRFDALLNSESMILSRKGIPEEFVSADCFAYCNIDIYDQISDGETTLQRRLSGEEAYQFYTDCILPDLKDTELGTEHLFWPDETDETAGDSVTIYVTFMIDPTEQALKNLSEKFGDRPTGYSQYYEYGITKNAARSAAFLERLGYSFDPAPLG